MELTIRRRIASYLLISSLAFIAVCLSMFHGWEMGGESWGYWHFARVFAETGSFVVPDRSPLYTLYLILFTWMPYPTSVAVEYLVTTSICVIVLIVFFRPYLGFWLALLAACIWIPYLQTAEPPVQKLALACSLIAVLLRNNKADRFRLVSSYAFLILACLFRQTYILLIIVFLSSDMLRTMRGSGIRTWFSWRPKLASDWPIILSIGLFFWFLFAQSLSPWNNVGFTNTEWFPGDWKSMASGAAVHAFNWIYILLKYGTFAGHDIYFTNMEAFGGATNYLGMLHANPQVFFEIIVCNLKDVIPTIMQFIWLPKTGTEFIDYFFMVILFVGIIYGAFRAVRDWPTKILFFSSLALVGVTVISIPKYRYMFPMIPIFIMAASWYGSILASLLKKLYPTTEMLLQKMALAVFVLGIVSLLLFLSFLSDPVIKSLHVMVFLAGTILATVLAGILFAVARFGKAHLKQQISRLALALPTILLLGMFSNVNIIRWAEISHNVATDVVHGKLRLLENREVGSMKIAYPKLVEITKNCKGILSLESTFLGAFLDIPQSRVYAVWEIPPFGDLKNSSYKGLNPDRIDCVLVSSELASGVGAGTNYQIRYQSYIKPYVSELKSLGAVTYEVPYFGQAVVLQR
ncbi:MAG: hypothetical protein NTX44_11090 [Ignavibacteriales bacterium]|nr:hypothetical protein [Ignavibacteriales bacterium]